jgi:membrane fusion protein (multidrug efflux system)
MALTRIPIILASAGLVLAALALPGCKGKSAAADDTDPTAGARAAPPISLPVVGAPVRKGDLVLSVATTGQVRAAAVAHLKAETAGTVQEVLVHPGDRVHRGQALVKLDPRPFDLAVEDAEAQVAAARVSYQDNIVPDSLVTGHAPTAERRANALARSGLQGAQVNLEKAKLDRERATITAPFEGVVDEVNVADGERVGVGGDIATVVDIDNLRIEAAVLEHDLPLIRRGGDAVVIPAATPDHPLHGTIEAILPLVDSTTRAGRALVRVRNSGVLRPGM